MITLWVVWRTRRRSSIANAILALAIAVAGASSTVSAQNLASTPPAVCIVAGIPPTTVLTDSTLITGVVVRFTSNANAKETDAHLAKALSVSTSEQLQELLEAPVRSRFELGQQGDDARSAIAEGRVLGVRWVVTGRAERWGDSVSITWNLLDSRTGMARGAGSARDLLVRLDALSSSVSLAIARKIGFSGAAPAREIRMARSVPAMEQYLAGIFEYDSFNPESQRRAVTALTRAVEAEPELRAGWAALAVTLTRLVEWGEGGSARGRKDRSRDALVAANRALALAPRDPQALSVIAHLHILRDEILPGVQAVDALKRVAPSSAAIPWLVAEAAVLRGGDVSAAIDRREFRASRNVQALFAQADGDRVRGRTVQACQALNRLLVLDPSWAPAYVERALVRTALGDLRGGWQDAEMATRLGQPSWGELVSAYIDFSVHDSLRTRARLKRIESLGDSTVLPWFDALLRGAVYRSTGQFELAVKVLSLVPCDDPRRRRLLTDPLLRTVRVPTACKTSVGGAKPANQLAN